jgi:hypothetical protein
VRFRAPLIRLVVVLVEVVENVAFVYRVIRYVVRSSRKLISVTEEKH